MDRRRPSRGGSEGKERQRAEKGGIREQITISKDPDSFSDSEYAEDGLRADDLSRRGRSKSRQSLGSIPGSDDFPDDWDSDDIDGMRGVRESLRQLSAKIHIKWMEEEADRSRRERKSEVGRPSGQFKDYGGARRTEIPHTDSSRPSARRQIPEQLVDERQTIRRTDTRKTKRDTRSGDGALDDDESSLVAEDEEPTEDESLMEESGEKVTYVFYMQTEEGALVGPFKFEVDDIQTGLPTVSVQGTQAEGLKNRQTGSHGLNEFSSRSHSVLTVTIDSETQPDTEDESLYVTKRGKLSFVDLAGSEKVKDASGSFGGPGMLESNSINKSLLVLGNCISHLGDAKRRQGHIPYRDSKLTKLLSDSLGGHGITLMIACITPSSANITETMNTLRYASRAKKIKTKPTVKMDPREKLIMSLKREIKILRNENHYLRQQLDFPAKPKGQLQKENDEKFMKFMKEQKEKETGLYEMLQEYMVENENLRSENSEMHSTRDRIRREQQLLYRENEKLMKRVEELERVVSQNPSFWAMAQHPERTDGYGQFDLASPRSSPVAPGFQSGLAQKGYTGQASPPGSRGKGNHPGPMRPPHRLSDSVVRPAQRPAEVLENGAVYVNNGFATQRPAPRQTSPVRNIERRASQMSNTDAVYSMNEQLKREVAQLEGEIRHQQYVHERTQDVNRNSYGNPVR